MSVSLSSSIAVPIAKQTIRLTFTATAGNFVRVWCTAAPPGSRLRAKLDENKASRIHVIDADSNEQTEHSFEVSGAYQFVATEITKGAAPYGGGYQFAPNAAPAEAVLGETPLTLYVAAGIKAKLGFGADTAELVLFVANDSIIATTLAVHGFASPAIQKAASPRAATIANSASVLAAIAALPGTTAVSSLGSLWAHANNIISQFNGHIASTTFHATADSVNTIGADWKTPTTAEALKRTLSKILKCLSSHIRNDSSVTPLGTGTSPFHVVSSAGVVDWDNLPLFDSSSSLSEHIRALADAWRAFDAHQVSAAHITIDNTFRLLPLPALPDVHRLFINQLAQLSPTAPITDNSAKTLLVHGAGFEEI